VSIPATNSHSATAAIWLIDSQTHAEHDLVEATGWLNAEELARAQRFMRAERRTQFLIGRKLLRLALGHILQVEPAALEFTERRDNVPLLHWSAAMPGYSLAHSGSWIACAVSRHALLGLDVEVIDPQREIEALAVHAFNEAELATLQASAATDRLLVFYDLWTRKEARYKLASQCTSASAVTVHDYKLPHPEVAITLSSAKPLCAPPELIAFSLP
jgi:4'-phosphopantetheinyl transferase